MAKRFFNQRVKKGMKLPTSSIVIIVICAILITIAIGIIISTGKKNKPGSDNPQSPKIVVRDSLTVEINNQMIDKTLFFTELENVQESAIQVNYNGVNFSKVGEYPVTIRVNSNSYSSKIVIVDSETPVLELKELTIKKGETYVAKDFVKSCKDNSNGVCKVDFYTLSVDQNGNKIDYSAFKEEGKYTVLITAKDEAGNETTPISTSLTIGSGKSSTTTPINCKFGNSEYDTEHNILAVDITESGCALDLNLYQKEETLKAAHTALNNDEERIKSEYRALNMSYDVTYSSTIDTILNLEGSGIVGQSIHVDLIINKDGQQETIASYNINKEGKRVYTINAYDFK